MTDRIDKLNSLYVMQDWFDRVIQKYTTTDKFAELEKKVNMCAKQDKTVAMMSRIETMFETLNKRTNTDFPTKDMVNKQLKNINLKLGTEYVAKFEFRAQTGKI